VRACPKRWPLLRAAVAEESMLPGIRPGDWLLARRATRVRPGQVVLAWHPERPGFLLVKRVAWREDGGWWLVSDNPFAAGAADSARFGPVPRDDIVAVVLLRYWPLRRSSPRRAPDLSRLPVSAVAPRAVRPPAPPAC
jgi:nickel-type superoxide dismutase maturation protease